MPAKGLVQKFQRAFPRRWDVRRDYRLFDERRHDLGPYYIGWSPSDDALLGECWEGRPMDASGVLQTATGAYEPIDILQFGLQRHADWIRGGNAGARSDFLAQADWAALAQATCRNVPGVYEFPRDWKRYACAPGFRSAMAQGQAISLLLRAYQETAQPHYLQRAVAASASFFHSIEEGGVTWHGGDGAVIFEEAAALPPSHILNGWIYALWGLFELARTVRDARVEALCRRSLDTLKGYLPHYDAGAWSYYHLLAAPQGFRRYATLKYHAFHIAQLHVLTSMTGDDYFSDTATQWESYIASPHSRRKVIGNALVGLAIAVTTRADTIPGGARSVV